MSTTTAATATTLQLLHQVFLQEESTTTTTTTQLMMVVFVTVVISTVVVTLLSLIIGTYILIRSGIVSPALLYHSDQRRRLPKTIIVIRHGESEANANKELWKTIPDNLLGLTIKGQNQATNVGKRVEKVLQKQNAQRVHLVISPFERTLQTAHHLRKGFEPRIVRTEIESRIREQEVGNLQGDEFALYRQEQKKVGRFWYRFPTGESGADVLDRVKSWWQESVLTTNTRIGYDPVDAIVVVTHGLTIRFILTQLFGWSPTTFHSVWNAGNCDMYVLQKDLKFPGLSPYALSETLGDVPKSSIDVSVTTRDGNKQLLKLNNYLGIPPPRTKQMKLIRRMLCQQYPKLFPGGPKDILEILIMPFIEGGIIRGRSTTGSVSRRMQRKSLIMQQAATTTSIIGTSSSSTTTTNEEEVESSSEDEDETMVIEEADESMHHQIMRRNDDRNNDKYNTEDGDDDDDDDDNNNAIPSASQRNREQSLRYPCCKLQNLLKDLE